MNKFEYKKLTPFKWFILENFPFIEADFDALTEWQLFCKLGKEMNKIINSENILGTQMENVTNAFIELQNYVNNYFNNLDVQEEINNKLNDMVEDGTLQEIITQYLQINGLLCFNTVNDMKNATNLINGSFVKTYGFYEKNDFGGNFYKIRELQNTDNIDEMILFPLINFPTLVAELVLNNNITPLNLGAKGNGLDNDTNYLQKYFDLDTIKNKIIPNKVFKTNELIIKENSYITFQNTTFIRNEHKQGRFININDNSIINGYLKVDGNKETNIDNLYESGIALGNNINLLGILESYNNTRHGIIVNNNSNLYNLIAYNNGLPSVEVGFGTGDGIYLINVNDTIIHNATAYNNTRNGITVSTYDAETTGTDLTLSNNVYIENANCYDNIYVDVDYEATSNATFKNSICKKSLSASFSNRCNFENIKCGIFYSQTSNNLNVNNMICRPQGNVGNVFFASGDNLNITNVKILDTADSYTINTFEVNDTANNSNIQDILVEKGYNSIIITGAKKVCNLKALESSNFKYNIDGRRIEFPTFYIEDGLLNMYFDRRPGTGWGLDNGTYKKGDKTYITEQLTEEGNAGSKYINLGYVNMVTGAMNSANWLPMRVLNGN